MVKIKDVRLSNNPDATVAKFKEGVNGEINKTSDDRMFCVVELVDESNPFHMTRRVINYSADESGKWQGATPKDLYKLIGKELSGARTHTDYVEAYEIGERTVTTFSSIILPHENYRTVFLKAGHPIIELDMTSGEVIESKRQPVEVGE